jgi:hypothetical protein
MTNAKSQLALSLVSILFALEKQLGINGRRIEELFERDPDHDLFGSLPAPDLRLDRVFCPKSAMIGVASAGRPNRCSAWRAPQR